MWSMLRLAVLASGPLVTASALAAVEDLASAQNPIRKVVTMLQTMQQRVEKEGEEEKALYEKFMCYCSSGGGELSASISAAETKVPAVQSEIEASEGKLAQTQEDLKQAQVDRTAAKDAMAEATALREKEAVAFKAEKAEYDANIGAIKKAVASLERGMAGAGAFLQTAAAQVLLRLAQSSRQDMVDLDRQELLAFLSGTQGTASAYAPQSGEISGILKEMCESMEKSLAEATATEESSAKAHQEMMAAKTKEVEALSESIESKTKAIGELGVSIVMLKDDLDDTQAALIADQKFLAELERSCSTKTSEWEERSRSRSEEIVALAETIKVLSDDDALELFKKTLPSASASFVQLAAGASRMKASALAVLRAARERSDRDDRAQLDLLLLTLEGRRAAAPGGFEKVLKMVDNMIEILKKEQVDDDSKKEYCAHSLDAADDKKKDLAHTITEHENAIATGEETMSTLTEEIAALEKGIKDLDKAVLEATEQRKNENVEYKELMASNGAAKGVLEYAKNRLNKFYNSALYKAPP